MIADAMAGLQRWIRAQYWSRRDHVSASRGAADAGLPVALNAAGLLDSTIAGGTLTGGGTVATGGFTLTVPATGTAALRNVQNTFTETIRVPGTINEERFALDSSGATISLTAGQSLPISPSGAFSGLVAIVEVMSGTAALYLMGGLIVTLVSGGPLWTAGTPAGLNQYDIAYVGGKYQLKNKYATTQTLHIMALRVRNFT